MIFILKFPNFSNYLHVHVSAYRITGYFCTNFFLRKMWTGKRSQLKYLHITHGHALIPCASGTWERRTMFIRKYSKPVLTLHLPEDTGLSIRATCEANVFIQQASEEPTPSKKRKYTDDQQAKVGKFAAEHINAAALKKFKTELPDMKVRCGCSKITTTTNYMYMFLPMIQLLPYPARNEESHFLPQVILIKMSRSSISKIYRSSRSFRGSTQWPGRLDSLSARFN